MSSQTTNLNLVKPAVTEAIDISVINGNMDIIDAAVGLLNTGKANVSDVADAAVASLKRGNQINATSTNHVSVHSLAVGRWYIGQSSVAYVEDIPSGIQSGIQVTVEEMQLTNRFVITLLINNNQEVGNVYKQWNTSAGWSAWFKFAGEAVT